MVALHPMAIEIPEELYARVQQTAQEMNRPVEYARSIRCPEKFI